LVLTSISTLFPYTTLFRSRSSEARFRCHVAPARRSHGRHGLSAERESQGEDLRAQGGLRRLWRRSAQHFLSQGRIAPARAALLRSEEHTSELQSPDHLVCR